MGSQMRRLKFRHCWRTVRNNCAGERSTLKRSDPARLSILSDKWRITPLARRLNREIESPALICYPPSRGHGCPLRLFEHCSDTEVPMLLRKLLAEFDPSIDVSKIADLEILGVR